MDDRGGHASGAARSRVRRDFAALALAGCAILAGCAQPPLAPAIERLTPEQVAALPEPTAKQAEEATRITRQADQEARQAAAAAAAQREAARWRALPHAYPPYPYGAYPRWSLGAGSYPYGRRGWSAWYGW